MQLTAKLTQLLAIQTGTGKNGEWKKQDIIIETEGQYPRKICVSVWGENIDYDKLKVGNYLILDIEIKSTEYNNKWYTNIIATKIETSDATDSDSVVKNMFARQEKKNEILFHSFIEATPIEAIPTSQFSFDTVTGGFLTLQNYNQKKHYSSILQIINSEGTYPLLKQYYVDVIIYYRAKIYLRVNEVIRNAKHVYTILSITGLSIEKIAEYYTGPEKSDFDSSSFERQLSDQTILSLTANNYYRRDSGLGLWADDFFPWWYLVNHYQINMVPIRDMITLYNSDHIESILFQLIVSWSKMMNDIDLNFQGYFKFRCQEILNILVDFDDMSLLVSQKDSVLKSLYDSILVQEGKLQSIGYLRQEAIK